MDSVKARVINHMFVESFNELAAAATEHAVEAGFHDSQRTFDVDVEVRLLSECTKIALLHSEISEALEALRHGNPPSEKIPEFSGVEEELADTLIRIMDYAGSKGLRVAEAVIAKMEYNRNRPYLHGGKAV